MHFKVEMANPLIFEHFVAVPPYCVMRESCPVRLGETLREFIVDLFVVLGLALSTLSLRGAELETAAQCPERA